MCGNSGRVFVQVMNIDNVWSMMRTVNAIRLVHMKILLCSVY